MPHRFQIIVMHPGTLVDSGELEAITRDYLDALESLGGRCEETGSAVDDRLPFFLLVATGGSEGVILEWWAKHRMSRADDPLWLIAHPGNNSLPASLEVLARLQQDGIPGRIFYLQGSDDAAGLQEISNAAADLQARWSLRRARIGIVGPPSDWLVASMPEASTVKNVWGPTVVPVEMDDVVSRLESATDGELRGYADGLVEGATEVREPTTADVRGVVEVYVALSQIVDDLQLDALTVRCFDFVRDQRTTGCFALAQLSDDGVTAGCEGDLVSTVGMLWARLLLGGTPWMANPAQLDPQENTLWLAHCTVPRSLVSDYGLRSHFESGLGVGIQGRLPTGPVTLLRIGGEAMDRVWLAEGENEGSGAAENLCRTQAKVRLTRGGSVTDLLRAPLGNHLVMIAGHHLERLQSWCTGFSVARVISDYPQ